MSDIKVTWVGANYAVDVTSSMAGVNNALNEEDKTEMTDWEKYNAFWDMILQAQIRREKDNADNR